MRKLKLDLDDLAVETFDPRPGLADPRGTLFGHDGTGATVCWGGTCPGCEYTQLRNTECATCWEPTCVPTECGTCGETTCSETCGC
jgi:hypothetical protein